MQLADDYSLSTVDDKGAALSHTWQVNQENFLFFNFAGLLHDQLNSDVQRNRVSQVSFAALIGTVLNSERRIADKCDFAFFFDEAAIVVQTFFAELDLRTILTHRQTEAVIIVFKAEVPDVVLDWKNFSEYFFQPVSGSLSRFLARLKKPFERLELDVDKIRYTLE